MRPTIFNDNFSLENITLQLENGRLLAEIDKLKAKAERLEKENYELLILAKNCKKYIFERKRKYIKEDDDMCMYVSTMLQQIEFNKG